MQGTRYIQWNDLWFLLCTGQTRLIGSVEYKLTKTTVPGYTYRSTGTQYHRNQSVSLLLKSAGLAEKQKIDISIVLGLTQLHTYPISTALDVSTPTMTPPIRLLMLDYWSFSCKIYSIILEQILNSLNKQNVDLTSEYNLKYSFRNNYILKTEFSFKESLFLIELDT
jgi:hypothetical protein